MRTYVRQQSGLIVPATRKRAAAAAATYYVSDSFAGADATTMASRAADLAFGGTAKSWTVTNGAAVLLSNGLRFSTVTVNDTTPYKSGVQIPVVESPNVAAEVTLLRLPTVNNTGVLITIRENDHLTFYGLACLRFTGTNKYYFFKNVAGTTTNFTGSPFSSPVPAANDVLKIQAFNGTITAYVNGVSLGSFTDNDLYTTRSVALRTYQGNGAVDLFETSPAWFDNFKVSALSNDYSGAVLADSPIVYFAMRDRSAQTPAIQAMGSLTPTVGLLGTGHSYQQSVGGKLAVKLTAASSQGFGITDNAALSPEAGASGKLTLEAWIRVTGAFSSAMMIVTKGNSNQYEWDLRVNVDGTIKGTVSALNGTDVISVNSPSAISLDTWYHVAFTYNRATPTAVLYINGTAVASANSGFVGNASDGTGDMQIGHRQDNGGTYFNGYIGHVAVYGTDLSATRIALHAAYDPQ